MLNSQDRLFILLVVILVFCIVYFLGPILTPFLAGALLAYLANPLVTKLMRFKLSRNVSVAIVFISMFSLATVMLILLVPFIERQINILIAKVPDMITWLQTVALPWVSNIVPIDTEAMNIASLKSFLADNWSRAGGVTTTVLKSILHSGTRALEWLLNLLLIPVVTFYLLCDWPLILANLQDMLPRRMEPTVVKLVKECDEVLGAFIRGQLLVMLALGVIYSVGLSLLGLQFGLLIGVVAGLLSIVPYLGFIIGILSASIAAFMQFGTVGSVAMVVLVFLIGHIIDHVFLTPKLVGDRIGLHPVAVIFAILAGGCLFGFVGVLLALPVAAMMMVWGRYLHQRYHRSSLYKA